MPTDLSADNGERKTAGRREPARSRVAMETALNAGRQSINGVHKLAAMTSRVLAATEFSNTKLLGG